MKSYNFRNLSLRGKYIWRTNHLNSFKLGNSIGPKEVQCWIRFGYVLRCWCWSQDVSVFKTDALTAMSTDPPVWGSAYRGELHWALNKRVNSSLWSSCGFRVLQTESSSRSLLAVAQSLQVTLAASERKLQPAVTQTEKNSPVPNTQVYCVLFHKWK